MCVRRAKPMSEDSLVVNRAVSATCVSDDTTFASSSHTSNHSLTHSLCCCSRGLRWHGVDVSAGRQEGQRCCLQRHGRRLRHCKAPFVMTYSARINNNANARSIIQAEYCTGTTNTCPTDKVEPNTTLCRASLGDCDVKTLILLFVCVVCVERST
jgi:hypothetical protein